MNGFLDTETAPAIKPTPQNKGQNVDTKYRLNGRDLRYLTEFSTYNMPYQRPIFTRYLINVLSSPIHTKP